MAGFQEDVQRVPSMRVVRIPQRHAETAATEIQAPPFFTPKTFLVDSRVVVLQDTKDPSYNGRTGVVTGCSHSWRRVVIDGEDDFRNYRCYQLNMEGDEDETTIVLSTNGCAVARFPAGTRVIVVSDPYGRAGIVTEIRKKGWRRVQLDGEAGFQSYRCGSLKEEEEDEDDDDEEERVLSATGQGPGRTSHHLNSQDSEEVLSATAVSAAPVRASDAAKVLVEAAEDRLRACDNERERLRSALEANDAASVAAHDDLERTKGVALAAVTTEMAELQELAAKWAAPTPRRSDARTDVTHPRPAPRARDDDEAPASKRPRLLLNLYDIL